MPALLLLIGALIFVVAYRGTQAGLATALETDLPGFLVWGVAIVALGAAGEIPGIRPIAKAMIVLVIAVIFLVNYQAIVGQFSSLAQTVAPTQVPATPASQYAAAIGSAGLTSSPAGGIQGLLAGGASAAAGSFLDAGVSDLTGGFA